MAIHKKNAVSNPSNYRGVHLTTVFSKVAEKLLNALLIPFWQRTDGFGSFQFAFQKGLSCKDLVAALVCSWILALNGRKKVGVFLSDISGAFDKVEVHRLMAKLEATGINNELLNLLRDYLSAREAYVVVNGERSARIVLANTVFQGTVLGPSLWNVFFKDVAEIPELKDATPSQFADDLTVTNEFPPNLSNSFILSKMQDYVKGVHLWGQRNRVEFDPKKK